MLRFRFNLKLCTFENCKVYRNTTNRDSSGMHVLLGLFSLTVTVVEIWNDLSCKEMDYCINPH